MTNPTPNTRQYGFTLVGLMIAMAVAGILTAGTVPLYFKSWNERRTEITAAEIWQIATAAQKWETDNGAWPDAANGCANAVETMLVASGYLAGLDDRSPWYDATANPGGRYTTRCTATNFSVQVTTDTEYAGMLANTLAATTASGATTTTSVPIGTQIPALARFLPKDGSEPMEGTLDMDGHDVVDINNLNSVNVTSQSINNSGTASTNTLNASQVSTSNVNTGSYYASGNGNTNDVYLRRIGRWASELNGDIINNTNLINRLRGWANVYATSGYNTGNRLNISRSADGKWVSCGGINEAVKSVYIGAGGGSNTNWIEIAVQCGRYQAYVD